MEDEKAAERLRYVRARNKAKSLVRTAKRAYEKQIADRAKWNPKPFWAYTRRKLKTVTGVSALLKDVNDPTSIKFTAKEKAEILQKQFFEPDGNLPVVPQAEVYISDTQVTIDCLKEILHKINKHKSIVPDNLHPKLLKDLAIWLADPITTLFNFTLKHGVLPKDWKIGHIFPIYKKGSKKNAENCRPISLTSVLCKIMEQILRSHLMKHHRK